MFAENLLGIGTPHPKTADFIGYFFAVSFGEMCINYERSDFAPIGVHAGLTEKEMTVPFIAFEAK